MVPLFVLGLTGGNWRRALEAWLQFAAILLMMAAPAALIGGCTALMLFMGWRKQDWYPGFRMEDLGSMQRLLGNSMHLGNVTSVLAVAMACAKA